MRRAPKRGTARFSYELDQPQAVIHLPDEVPGSLALRGADAWISLPPASADGYVLTTLLAGGLCSWQAPSGGGGGGGGPDFVTTITARGFTVTGSSEAVFRGPDGQGTTLMGDSYVAIRPGNGVPGPGKNVYIDLPGIGTQCLLIVRDSTFSSNFVLAADGRFNATGMHLTLGSGFVFEVMNAAGQRIFDVDQSGNVRAAGTITPLLGAGF